MGDIIEVIHKKKLCTAKIVSFSNKGRTVSVVLHDAKKTTTVNNYGSWAWKNSSYHQEKYSIDDIIRVVKRKGGSACKKKYEIILIDKDGNITDK